MIAGDNLMYDPPAGRAGRTRNWYKFVRTPERWILRMTLRRDSAQATVKFVWIGLYQYLTIVNF